MKSDDFSIHFEKKKTCMNARFVLESVLDFYIFRVNHTQFYVHGNTGLAHGVIVRKIKNSEVKVKE